VLIWIGLAMLAAALTAILLRGEARPVSEERLTGRRHERAQATERLRPVPLALIIGEPLIAANVLTAMNSPIFGLKAPVSSIEQAVTYLGLNTVRSLCLQYILIAWFKADSAERKLRLDAVWTASALASELTQQLSHRLGFEDRGSLVSAVVLSFLGRLATTATMSRDEPASIPSSGLLGRTLSEQQILGAVCVADRAPADE
jgi:hypothetical protein